MGSGWNKFLLLMWKNWVLQYRRPIQTLVEIVVPVLFSIILVLIRSLVDPKPHEVTEYKPFYTIPFNFNNTASALFNISDICKLPGQNNYNYLSQNHALLYAPKNKATEEVMSHFEDISSNITRGFDSSAEMEAYYAISGGNSTLACVEFDKNFTDSWNYHVKYSLRFPGELKFTSFGENNWRTNLIFPIFQTAGPREYKEPTGATPNYYKEGFLALQHLITTFITLHQAKVRGKPNNVSTCPTKIPDKLPFIYMKRLPYAAWEEDVLLTPLKSFVSLIVMLSFVYTCINTVKAITTEKEKQLKEAMKIMGLPGWLQWLAWFLKTFSYLMVSIIIMVILLKVKWYPKSEFTVFTYANPFVLLIFLFFYICSTITFCFAVSVFFSKANTASTIAGMAWFLSYAPYSFMQNNYDTLSLTSKLLASLGSNTAMAFGFQVILMYEGTSDGIQFENIWKPNTPDDNLSLGTVLVMLAVDTILYLVIALYVEAVFPGEYGVPHKWYFLFTADFWRRQPKQMRIEDTEDAFYNEGEYFEVEPKNLHPGIKIRNLRKVFGSKTAVRNLTLNIYEDQITVLLGHNGAGKTTTMSMLTGMFPATSGVATVNGYDIRTQMESVRESLGLCPQHNIIFDDLTVAEHIYFFSKLKGLRGEDIKNEIDKYLDLLELQPKRNKRSSTLSGGMKRKLSVGIALCGNSKVVMLDEPTAGMDPSARRALWDLLLTQKTGRTMLLTTHFMDEADLLGDRIAIMAGGELQCCGSSFFLKKKYGAGYHLIMDKSSRCDPEKVTNILRKHIPNIEVNSNIGSELTYVLAESQSYVFETMLRDLEQHSEELGINSYGISLTTLEEVFMKVGADSRDEDISNEKHILGRNDSITTSETTDTKLFAERVSSLELLKNQITAMSLKRTLSIIRSWILLLIQIILPMIFLIIVMTVARQQTSNGNLPPLSLDLSKFDNPVTLFEKDNGDSIYEESYRNVVGNAFKPVPSINETVINLTRDTPVTVRRSYVGGVSPSSAPKGLGGCFDASLTTYFNNDPYHTPAISLALTLNAAHQKILDCKYCRVEVVNHPMPYSSKTMANQLETGNNMGFQIAFNICFSMAFVSSFYIIFIVRERASKCKHLQFVSGVNVYIFWLTNLFWDFITYLITIAVLLITIVCFQEDGFKTPEDVGRLFVIFLYFGWSMLPMIYIAAFFFDIPSTGYTRMTVFSIFTGCAAFLVIQVLNSPALDLEHIGNALHWIFLVVPHYSLGTGIRDVYTLYSYNSMCDKIYQQCKQHHRKDCGELPDISDKCKDIDENYFKWEGHGIGRNIVYSVTVGFVLFIILFLAEYKVFSNIIYIIRQKYSPKYPSPVADEDSDVQAENYNIKSTPQADLLQNYTMIVKDMTKYYKNFLAVNGLCLGVKTRECFGLLGINGAGKTSTFKMLTGDVKMTHGDAWINAYSVKNQVKQVQKLIGYCPQFDALLDDLTARETLMMFSLLRGIPYNRCKKVADKLASDFDYQRHLDKKVKELSGGNKRKLSTSIALIGDPPVIYLDEPTTGMDPATRRYLWNALCQVRDNGKTIILTSHSMEECEALCTRLAIMVNGNFKCLGSTQHLKTKFAEGYTLTIKIKKPKESFAVHHSSTEQIEQFISQNFIGAILREKHEELLTYHITDKSKTWSEMFGILEGAKRRPLNIEDYSIGQCSLEQVFLTFTKQQYIA